MKNVFLFLVVSFFTIIASGQKQNFDLVTYTAPSVGWKKKVTNGSLQLSKENKTQGTYCLITLFKSIPGTLNTKDNFDAAWRTLVKENITVSSDPEMRDPVTENGWEAQTGYATFESDGSKGVAILVTSSGYEKMVNILILSNSDVYEAELTTFLESISLKKPVVTTKTVSTTTQQKPLTVAPVTSNGFAFSTTNFDDGWTSSAKEDWVEVTKGNIKVLLHYPKEGTIFPADPEPLTNAAWNILVSPRYSNLKNYKTTSINTYQRPYLGFGNAVDNATGKEVFVLLFRQANSGWIEFITADKNTFEQFAQFDPYVIRWDSENSLLNPLIKMVNYNKFSIAVADFNGNWTSDFSGMQQLYNVYTGQYVGMNVNQSSQTFEFGAGNTYRWKIIAVSGMVGTMNYNQKKSSGTFSVINNWQVSFSEIEGKPKTYDAYFSCIKGGRILWMNDAKYPGSGVFTGYGKQK